MLSHGILKFLKGQSENNYVLSSQQEYMLPLLMVIYISELKDGSCYKSLDFITICFKNRSMKDALRLKHFCAVLYANFSCGFSPLANFLKSKSKDCPSLLSFYARKNKL